MTYVNVYLKWLEISTVALPLRVCVPHINIKTVFGLHGCKYIHQFFAMSMKKERRWGGGEDF